MPNIDPFDPPQHPLFAGGNYSWEPTGMSGATRGGGMFPSYHQPLGYNLYANAFPAEGMFQSGRGQALPFGGTESAPTYGYPLDPNRGDKPPSVLSSQESQQFRQSQTAAIQRTQGIFTNTPPPMGSQAPDINAYYRASSLELGGGVSAGGFGITPYGGQDIPFNEDAVRDSQWKTLGSRIDDMFGMGATPGSWRELKDPKGDWYTRIKGQKGITSIGPFADQGDALAAGYGEYGSMGSFWNERKIGGKWESGKVGYDDWVEGQSSKMGGGTSAIVPYTGFGGTMPNTIYSSGAQDDPRRLLDEFATSLKERLNPAMRESIEHMKQLPSRAGGMGGGRGGFGGRADFIEGEYEVLSSGGRGTWANGGQFMSYGGTGNWEERATRGQSEFRWFDGGGGGGMIPPAPPLSSTWGNNSMGQMSDPRSIAGQFMNDLAKGLPKPDEISFNVWKASMAWQTFGGSAVNAANYFQNQQASQELMFLQTGAMDYGDLMGGMYGNITQRRGRADEFQYEYGRQASSSIGGLMNLVGGAEAGRGLLGTAMALGLPAAGIGLGAGALSGGNPFVALGAGAAALGAETLGYVSGNMSNYYDIGQAQNAARSGDLLSLLNQPGGIAGWLGNFMQGKTISLGAGTTDPRMQNAGAFASVVDRVAAGGVDIREASQGLEGYSMADVLPSAVDQWLQTANTKYGIDRQSGGQLLSSRLRFNPNVLPVASQMENAFTTSTLGFDSSAMANQYASAYGINRFNIGAMGGLTESLERFISGSSNPLLSGQTLGESTALGGQYNTLYQAAGQTGYNDQYYQNMLTGNTDITNSLRLAITKQGLSPAMAGSDFFNAAGGNNIVSQSQAMVEAGNAPGATRLTGQWLGLQSRWQQSRVYGGALSEESITQLSNMGEADYNLATAIGAGNPRALSQNWQALGDVRFQTMDVSSDLPSMQRDMSPEKYDVLRREQGSLFRLSYAQASAGAWGIENGLRNTQRDAETYQFSQQNAARNMGYQLQAGGAGIGAGGFAVGGDGLAGLAGIFASQGMGFNAGNGMGMWQIQDASTLLSRRQQQLGIDQTGQGNDIARRRFDLTTGYQEQNMNINRQQQLIGFDWQATDMSMNRARAEMSYGFQQEDYDRNIRFATGRQRLDLMRNQERSSIFFAMDQTSRGQDEERFETQKQWAAEEFDRKKQYFEETKKLSQEELDMTKVRFEETKRSMTEQWALEDQRRLLDRQSEQAQFVMSTNLAQEMRKATNEANSYRDALVAISRQMQSDIAMINNAVDSDDLLKKGIDVAGGSGSTAIDSGTGRTYSVPPGGVAPLPPPTNYRPPAPRGGGGGGRPYATGGFVSEPGSVETGEYVVPREGGLVLRSEGGMSSYLMQMVRLLEVIAAYGPMRMNATVYSNAPVSAGDLYQQSKTKVARVQ